MLKRNKKGRVSAIDVHVGVRLKQIRKEKKLTQEEVAEMIGITFQQLQKYEWGHNRISAGKLFLLSSVLAVPLETFYEGLNVNEIFHNIRQEAEKKLAG